jgi:hypothetical protein
MQFSTQVYNALAFDPLKKISISGMKLVLSELEDVSVKDYNARAEIFP